MVTPEDGDTDLMTRLAPEASKPVLAIVRRGEREGLNAEAMPTARSGARWHASTVRVALQAG